ncbi:hypothetical protein H5410_005991 [Solanum commersonii]|uniref:Uncharacterized protein n=1 Tax=Solanum commersonii TaxID=4109 RepID=A0A9J6A844_SOLCO|nr:hypothetical protein H5410_005991 [Solanum commersonii]
MLTLNLRYNDSIGGRTLYQNGIMLQKLLEDMRDMKGKLEDVDRRVRTQEIAKQPLEIFNPSGQNDKGSSKTPLDATPHI